MINFRFVLAAYLMFEASMSYGQNSIHTPLHIRPNEAPLQLTPLPEVPVISTPKQQEEKESSSKNQSQKPANITINSILFEGNTVVTTTELDALAKPYLNKPIGVAEIEELRRAITHHYINQGYVTSGAIFPANSINGKTLRIKIVEGKIGEIRIAGQGRLRQGFIENRLIPQKDTPLNMNTLQDRFRLLLTDPLFERLNGRLIPGSDRGASILDLEVTRSKPYQLAAISDNYRAPSVGGIALGANAWIRNLTRQGDLIDFTFLTSAPAGGDAYQYSGTWLMPISDYGTRAYFSANNSNVSIIEEPLSNINIQSNSFTVEGGLNQLLIDSLQRRLSVGSGISFKDNETSLLGQSFSLFQG